MTTPANRAREHPNLLPELAGLAMLGAGTIGLLAIAYVIHPLLAATLVCGGLIAAGLRLTTREA